MEQGLIKWRMNLKVGDKVAVVGKYNEKSIETIMRMTKTQIITKFSRYRKKDGRQIGTDIWGGKYIQPLTKKFTDGLILTNRSRYLQNLINKTAIIDLGLERIEKIIYIIEDKPHDFATQSSGESLISVKRDVATSPNSPQIDNTKREEANFS